MYAAFVVFSTIAILLLPCWILLLILRRFSKGSRWKYPPTQRITQVLFCLGNLFFGLISLLQVGQLIFIAMANEWPGVIIGITILVLVLVSLIALFRPIFTYVILVCYLVMGGATFYQSVNKMIPPNFKDICNELRADKACSESVSGFNCEAPSKHAGKKFDKTVCENTTAGNDTYKFEEYKSGRIGNTVVTKIPSILISNLPRNDCRNRECGFKVDRRLIEFKNSCGGCLGPGGVTTELKMEFVPEGTSFKVVDSFKITRKSFLSETNIPQLILEAADGRLLEISESSLEYPILSDHRSWSNELERSVLADLESIKTNSSVVMEFCIGSYSKEDDATTLHKKFERFLNDIRIVEEVSNPPFVKKDGGYCSDITFNTESSYLLVHYYSHDWGLRGRRR